DLPADYYVTGLLYANSVNTAPLGTIDAFVKTGIKEVREPVPEREIDAFFALMQKKKIDIEAIYASLLEEGLDAFQKAFAEIMKELEKG
ncbi:MAG TPA: transaldolase, partial [Campylobacteraceae bacterium]|nr:transaldolase [Campylobacteraceae bacterium]